MYIHKGTKVWCDGIRCYKSDWVVDCLKYHAILCSWLGRGLNIQSQRWDIPTYFWGLYATYLMNNFDLNFKSSIIALGS